MKKIIWFILLAFIYHPMYAQTTPELPARTPMHTTPSTLSPIDALYARDKKASLGKYQDSKPIALHFDDEELIDVINYLATEQEANIILPIGANAITSKLTFSMNDPIALQKAWNLLYTFMDVAGYTLLPKSTSDKMYTIVKTSPAVSKEVIPLYVNVEPQDLPDSDVRIRYLYYLNNLRVSNDTNPANNTLLGILKELLPDTASYQFDPKVNALLLTEKANNIRSVMDLIVTLEQATFQESFDFVLLKHTSADMVTKLFNENILKNTGPDAAKYRAPGKRADGPTYFSDQVKLIPEPRTNKVLILGKAQAVARIKEFIYKYIDLELGSGESILHVYQLLYLDAASFANVLTNIVKSELPASTGQSTVTGVKVGAERFFEGVIIKADVPLSSGKEAATLYGSNKLIVAAKNNDWNHIKRIIEQLDKPQPQVILEVLIADLTFDDLRQLGTSIRNAQNLPLPGQVNFQAAHIAPVIPDSFSAPKTIAADLLGNVIPTPGGGFVSIASLTGDNQAAFPGSTLIQVSDPTTGKTWGITQILQLFNHTKILSHPHVIATNNQPATVTVGEQRLVPGETTATAAASTIKQDPIKADLKVTIKPRISASNNINLQVSIDITEFRPGSDTRITRQIITNAYVQSEDILALGGLIRVGAEDSLNETPILSKIPILGYFFKKRRNRNVKTNLTVFISPTVVQPRLRGGVNNYTKDYIKLSEKYINEAQIFDTLRDPITRFFFKTPVDAKSVINEFTATDESKRTPELVMLTPEEQQKVEEIVERKEVTGEIPKTRRRNQILASATT